MPIAGVAFLLTWFLPELKLRKTTEATHSGDVFALPNDRSSVQEMERALTVLARKENRRELFRRLTARAGLELEPAESWLLLRICRHPHYTAEQLARERNVPPARVRAILRRMQSDWLIAVSDGDTAEHPVVTDAGRSATKRLTDARCERLTELLNGWSPEEHDELLALVQRLTGELLDDEQPPQQERALSAGGVQTS